MAGTIAGAELQIESNALADLAKGGDATVVDLALSTSYRTAHIPGAWFAIRARLERALARIPVRGTLVLTSEDGVLARLAVAEAGALTPHAVRWLVGGNAAWRAAGYPLSSEAQWADDALDVWRKPYERDGDTRSAMSEYLAWETDLLARIARDGSCRFAVSPP